MDYTHVIAYTHGDIMAKYICDYCGKKYSRSGSRAANSNHHFCSRPCSFNYIRKYGSLSQKPKNKQKRELRKGYVCILCGDKHVVPCGPKKYCPTCLTIKGNYRAVINRTPGKHTFSEYLILTTRNPKYRDHINNKMLPHLSKKV